MALLAEAVASSEQESVTVPILFVSWASVRQHLAAARAHEEEEGNIIQIKLGWGHLRKEALTVAGGRGSTMFSGSREPGRFLMEAWWRAAVSLLRT